MREFPKPDHDANGYQLTARSRGLRPVALRGNNKRSMSGAMVCFLDGRWQAVAFESRHECLTGYILESNPNLTDLVDQFPAVTYLGIDGKVHEHTFDFTAVIDGKEHPIACKMRESAEHSNFATTLGLIKAQNVDTLGDISLVHEKHFSRERAIEATHIHFIARENDDEADEVVWPIVRKLNTTATIAEVVAASGLKGRAWRSIVRAIGRGVARRAGNGRIDDYRTRIAAAGSK
jgi:hypothetical protein